MDWEFPFKEKQSCQAIFAFNGDVYLGLDAKSFTKPELNYAQKKIRILSGLYGVLRPSDAILPYRLEMGSKVSIGNSKSLYQFWQNRVTEEILKELGEKNNYILDLASKEYSKVLHKKALSKPVITPVFKDYKNGTYKIISFFAKKARGLMANYVIRNRVTTLEQLQQFSLDSYYFVPELSSELSPVFHRDAQQ